jgi:hypothetical protein
MPIGEMDACGKVFGGIIGEYLMILRNMATDEDVNWLTSRGKLPGVSPSGTA